MKHLLFSLILIGLLSSCNLQKRKYLKGYYFDKQDKITQHEKAIESKKVVIEHKQQIITTSIPKTLKAYHSTETEIKKVKICDTLFLKDGVKMLARISDVNKNQIHYYLCDSDNEAEFMIETDKVSNIHYANGLTDNLNNPKDAPYDYSDYPNGPKYSKKELDNAAEMVEEARQLIFPGFSWGYQLPFQRYRGYALALKARKILRDQKGYESYYRQTFWLLLPMWISLITLGLSIVLVALVYIFG